MTTKQPHLEPFTSLELYSDMSWVIVGDHVSLITAQEMGKAEDLDVCDVAHVWVRYQFLTADDVDDIEDFDTQPAAWLLFDQENRPPGIVRKATLLSIR